MLEQDHHDDDSPVVPHFDDTGKTQMHILHPSPHPVRHIPLLPNEAPRVVITEVDIKHAVKKIDRGAAPGLSGMNGSILRSMVEEEGCLSGITALVQDIANGDVEPSLRDHILVCRLIPILKSFKSSGNGFFSDVEWRPIACGEAILKLAFLVVFKKVRAAMVAATQPI